MSISGKKIIYMKQPNVTQKIIIKDQENRTMILRHTDGNYDFPGGQLEWGEDLFAISHVYFTYGILLTKREQGIVSWFIIFIKAQRC